MPEIDPFRALFHAHAAFVWRVLQRHGVAEREREDACQEVFLVVHRRLSDFEGRSSMRTWIYGIAVRVALAFRRKGYRVHEQLVPLLPEPCAETELTEQAEQRHGIGLIDDALRSLPEAKREVFALYELEGMSMADVARALDIPANTALYRLYSARDDIRSFLAKRTQQRRSEHQASTHAPTTLSTSTLGSSAEPRASTQQRISP